MIQKHIAFLIREKILTICFCLIICCFTAEPALTAYASSVLPEEDNPMKETTASAVEGTTAADDNKDEEEEWKFEGWTDDNRDLALLTYSSTEWTDVMDGTGFIFDFENGVIASTNVPEPWRNEEVNNTGKTNEELVKEVLADDANNLEESYAPLLLTMIYYMHTTYSTLNEDQKGIDADYFGYVPLATNRSNVWDEGSQDWIKWYKDSTEEDIVYYMGLRLETAYNVYNLKYSNENDKASYYRNDEKLCVVIQGALWGTAFCCYADTYSIAVAKKYRNDTNNFIPSKSKGLYSFAHNVTGDYTALEAFGTHTVIG